ncbi:MAG TPA: haloalkane dehalogenase [Dehalococcoidales bacterium]|nr:haloalkane dehalogenase [Dehalococcoidales bacterium]
MKFITPSAEQLSYLRADPLLVEQELDIRPEVAQALERATGIRAGRVYWRSEHDHLYALELGDLGRGRPSTATVFGFWDRYEPRPPEHEIDSDLLDFGTWVAEVTEGMDPADIRLVAGFAQQQTDRVQLSWPDGSVMRTPEERFANLPDYPYEPRYVEIEGLRMAYVEEGSGDPILMLHGEPTWGYLYRHMIPVLSGVGRVIVPDQIGFGRSDKPVADNAYSYRAYVRWMRKLILELDLKRITLVCQDWGGLVGLRVVSQLPERFARIVPMNTGIPDGGRPGGSSAAETGGMGGAFMTWRRLSQRLAEFDLPAMMKQAVGNRELTEAEAAAYGAPFPSVEYQTAALLWPRQVPIRPDHPGAYDNHVAIEVLKTLELPVLLPWAEGDAITRAGEGMFRNIFRNCAPPLPIRNAGHFIQEDAGEEVAENIRRWILETPLP